MIDVNSFGAGKYELAVGMYDSDRLADYIGRYSKRYLVQLFGVAMYEEYVAQLDGNNVSTLPKFQELEDSFEMDYTILVVRMPEARIAISEGINEMLKGFVYFEYLKDSISVVTPVGMVKPSGENSTNPSTLSVQLYTRYNEAVRTYRAIQSRIMVNPSGYDYSNFNGLKKSFTTWI